MRRAWWYALGFTVIAVISLSAFLVSPNAEFGGADGEAEDVIGDIDPDYVPWAESLWEVPGETESLLFALQAAIGASIIGFFIGRYGKVPGGAPETVAD